jgi:hypothetical protein
MSWFKLNSPEANATKIRIERILKDASGDSHDDFTPFALCKEIVEKLPPFATPFAGKVLVVANLEFVYTLLKRGVDSTRVYFASPCNVKRDGAKSMGLPEKNVFQYTIIINEQDVQGMKFDVVISNPPYQEGGRADQANKLWPHFILKGADLLKMGGYMAMVTPNSWLTPSADIGKGKSGIKLFQSLFSVNQLVYANVDTNRIKTQYFPTTGSTFSWWIFHNVPYDCATVITAPEGTSEMDLRGRTYLPVIVTKTSLSIMDKISNVPNFVFEDQKHEIMSDAINGTIPSQEIQSKTFKFQNYHTAAKGGTYRWSATPHSCSHEKKVMISVSGKYLAVPDHGTMGYTGMCIVLKTELPDSAAAILNSKLYKFIIHNMKFSGFLPRSTILSSLPMLDLSRKWSDPQIYKHFNLTQEEIDLIETTVK